MALKALKVLFIINVLRAGFEAALLFLSIIYLLPNEDTPILWCQLRLEADENQRWGLILIKQGYPEP